MEEDWILSSVKKLSEVLTLALTLCLFSYELLHTFDLPQSASALDWGSGGNSRSYAFVTRLTVDYF